MLALRLSIFRSDLDLGMDGFGMPWMTVGDSGEEEEEYEVSKKHYCRLDHGMSPLVPDPFSDHVTYPIVPALIDGQGTHSKTPKTMPVQSKLPQKTRILKSSATLSFCRCPVHSPI